MRAVLPTGRQPPTRPLPSPLAEEVLPDWLPDIRSSRPGGDGRADHWSAAAAAHRDHGARAAVLGGAAGAADRRLPRAQGADRCRRLLDATANRTWAVPSHLGLSRDRHR